MTNLEQYLARLEEALRQEQEDIKVVQSVRPGTELHEQDAAISHAAQILETLIREEIDGNSKTVPCEATHETEKAMMERWDRAMAQARAKGAQVTWFDMMDLVYDRAIQAAPSRLQELIEGE